MRRMSNNYELPKRQPNYELCIMNYELNKVNYEIIDADELEQPRSISFQDDDDDDDWDDDDDDDD